MEEVGHVVPQLTLQIQVGYCYVTESQGRARGHGVPQADINIPSPELIL